MDTHLFRTSQRVGMIGARVTANEAHDLLLQMLLPEPEELYNFHMLRHGQRICTFNRPRCEQCVLNVICNYYQDVWAKGVLSKEFKSWYT
ncbi:endonuclease III domain-containing protein [Pontibacter sp. MBLB2868]|uniref:endonuclease III domain-containing protein n=1 Tax=Pontibacter sp. MBLB2868 TaxID=3451555 RepID=UPI003F751F20